MSEKRAYDVVVVGLGPAGLTAALFCTRYGMSVIVIGDDLGRAADAYLIENIPGIKSISGAKFAENMMEQVKSFGVKIEFDTVTDVKKEGSVFHLTTKNSEFHSRTIILALGNKQRPLGVPREKEFTGKGISYCATCDAALFKDKDVFVIGGGDSATTAAILVSEFATKVRMLVRKDKLRGVQFWIDDVNRNPKIEVMFNSELKEVKGKTLVESAVVEIKGEKKEFPIEGIFVEIGSDPRVGLAEKLGVKLEKSKHIIVDSEQKTNVEGVFAAGDCTNANNNWEQIIIAEAEGSIAGNSAYNYVKAKK